VTRATEKALVRVVDGRDRLLVVELRARTVRLRPLRVRDPHAAVELPWSLLYQHGLMAREAHKRDRAMRRVGL
jgi:hypothetical protein